MKLVSSGCSVSNSERIRFILEAAYAHQRRLVHRDGGKWGEFTGDQVRCSCSGSASVHAASRHEAISEASVGIDCSVCKVGEAPCMRRHCRFGEDESHDTWCSWRVANIKEAFVIKIERHTCAWQCCQWRMTEPVRMWVEHKRLLRAARVVTSTT